jgi:hypothetical protein
MRPQPGRVNALHTAFFHGAPEFLRRTGTVRESGEKVRLQE